MVECPNRASTYQWPSKKTNSCRFQPLFLCHRARNIYTKICKEMGALLNPSGRPPHLFFGTTFLTMRIGQLLCALILSILPITVPGQQIDAPQPQRGSMSGTVTDVDDAAIPGATLQLMVLGANIARSRQMGQGRSRSKTWIRRSLIRSLSVQRVSQIGLRPLSSSTLARHWR